MRRQEIIELFNSHVLIGYQRIIRFGFFPFVSFETLKSYDINFTQRRYSRAHRS